MLFVFLFLSAPQASGAPGGKEFSFGILADIQYADKPVSGRRRYPESLDKLAACIKDFNTRGLAFTIQLGDIIDGNDSALSTLSDLEAVLRVFTELDGRLYHVIGNHCLAAGRAVLLEKLGLTGSWYDFTFEGWRFIVLDGMDISTAWPGESENYRLARAFLKANPGAETYNGAVGEPQKAWLQERLETSARRRERVLVFCHHPLHGPAGRESLRLWNHPEISTLLEKYSCVKAYFNGHDHAGGYAFQGGIHYLTLPGMVEAPAGGNAYGSVDVYRDSLVVRGAGTFASRTLMLENR